MKTQPVKSPLIVTEEGTTLVDSRGVKILALDISPALPIAQAMLTAARLATAYNHHDALVSELGKADLITFAMLNAMTLEQKTLVAKQLEASGVSPDGMVRANEREAVLQAVGQ